MHSTAPGLDQGATVLFGSRAAAPKTRRSSGLAHSKLSAFMLPWTPSRCRSRSMSCQRHFQRPPTSANLLGSSVNVISKLATTRSPRPPSQGSQAWAEKPEEALRHRKRRRAPPRAPSVLASFLELSRWSEVKPSQDLTRP